MEERRRSSTKKNKKKKKKNEIQNGQTKEEGVKYERGEGGILPVKTEETEGAEEMGGERKGRGEWMLSTEDPERKDVGQKG